MRFSYGICFMGIVCLGEFGDRISRLLRVLCILVGYFFWDDYSVVSGFFFMGFFVWEVNSFFIC